METPEELMKSNFRNIITLLEVLYKRQIEQEIILNDIKIFLASRNENPEEQSSFNPLDFLLQSDNDESHQEHQEKLNDNESVAENSSEITCFDCKQIFKRGNGEFTKHLHTTTCKPYKCDVCLKLFKKKSNMMTHKFTHSDEVLACDMCDCTFKCRKYLENHRIRKHKITTNENVISKHEVKDEAVDNTENCDEEPPKKKVKYFDSDDFDKFQSKHL